MAQWYAVYLQATGELVSVGDFVQDAAHCICHHKTHPQGTESVANADGSKRTRPLGCPEPDCYHNYNVPTKGWQIKYDARAGLPDPPVLWSDPTGTADAPFVSGPLAADLVAVPIAGPPTAKQVWDPLAHAFKAVP